MKKVRKGTGLPKSAASKAFVAAHRHCQVCQTPISLKNDPPICGDAECDKEHEGRTRARKRWTILMYAAPGIMVLTFVISVM